MTSMLCLTRSSLYASMFSPEFNLRFDIVSLRFDVFTVNLRFDIVSLRFDVFIALLALM